MSATAPGCPVCGNAAGSGFALCGSHDGDHREFASGAGVPLGWHRPASCGTCGRTVHTAPQLLECITVFRRRWAAVHARATG